MRNPDDFPEYADWVQEKNIVERVIDTIRSDCMRIKYINVAILCSTSAKKIIREIAESPRFNPNDMCITVISGDGCDDVIGKVKSNGANYKCIFIAGDELNWGYIKDYQRMLLNKSKIYIF